MSRDRDLLGWYFWNQATSEGTGALIASRISHCRELTRVERDYAGDVVCREELRHRRMMQEMAAECCAPVTLVTLELREQLDAVSDLDLLAIMNHSEALFLRCFGSVETVYRALAPARCLDVLRVIKDDEERHEAWGAAVLRRLRAAGHAIRRPRIRETSHPEMMARFADLRRLAATHA